MLTCIHDLKKVFLELDIDGATSCSLLFSHPTIKHGLTNDGIPQINMDQLNNRHLLHPNNQDLRTFMPRFDSLHEKRYHDILFKDDSDEHDVWNATARVMKLTRGKLRKQDDWNEWKESEYLQLDQYKKQYMSGAPVKTDTTDNVFDLVWTYVEKVPDKRKKA